jgi:hypothetical protein
MITTKENQMKSVRAVPVVLGIALLGAAFLPVAKADEHNKKTTFTFTQPVEIPMVHLTGMSVLPPGTYVFKLLNSDSDRHIVQIFNKSETKIYATILAIPNYRLKPTKRTVLTFNEGLKGKPEALRAWFYPGANWGEEFVYPKDKAIELAKVSNIAVLAVTADVKLEAEKPEEVAVVTVLQQAPIVAVKPTGEVVEIAQVIQAPPPVEVAAAQAAPASIQDAPAELPHTASSLPLIALFGLLALSGALAMRFAQKRVL